MGKKQALFLVGIILTSLGGLITGLSIVGKEASMAPLLVLFFTGFGSGASLVQFIRKKGKAEN